MSDIDTLRQRVEELLGDESLDFGERSTLESMIEDLGNRTTPDPEALRWLGDLEARLS